MFSGLTSRCTSPARCAADKRAQHRLHDRDGFCGGEPPALAHPLADEIAQRASLHQLHHEEDVVAAWRGVVALVVHGDGVDVREPGRSAGLAGEPIGEGRVGRQRRGHDLHGDTPIEPLVDGRVHRGHPAAGNAVENPVATLEQAADQRVSGRRLHVAILRAQHTTTWTRSAATSVFSASMAGPVRIDTPGEPYHGGQIELLADADRPGGWLLLVDRIRQSYVDLDDPTYLDFEYVQAFADVLGQLPPGPLAVTHVGGGAGTLARYVAATRPRSPQIVLEPDAALTATVRARLPFSARRANPDPSGRRTRRCARARRCECRCRRARRVSRRPGAGRAHHRGVLRRCRAGAAPARAAARQRRGRPAAALYPPPCRHDRRRVARRSRCAATRRCFADGGSATSSWPRRARRCRWPVCGRWPPRRCSRNGCLPDAR